ncbi:hypothetical protein AHAS_Ahas12G0088800 [Arachis hypogaea]
MIHTLRHTILSGWTNLRNLRISTIILRTNSQSQQDSNWEMMRSFMQETRASIRNLEIQMGQLATKINEIDKRTINSLPGNTTPNPREKYKAILP